jgi:hypothetical protein
MIVARSRKFIGDRSYKWIMRILGVVLFSFSLYFLYDGIRYLSGNR